MYSPEVTIVAAGTGALILGIGLGFHLGKLYGMKLGIAARDFAESFGIGNNAMQAGTPTQGPFNIPSNAKSIKQVAVGGGGGGGYGGYGSLGAAGSNPNSLNDIYTHALKSGISPTDANKLISAEMQRRQQQAMYASALGAQKQTP